MDNLGIVYDIENDKAVVLTHNSNFVMVKRRDDMFLGQQITYFKDDIYRPAGSIYKYASLVSGIAAIFIMAFVFFRFASTDADVYGYIDVDINPSVEFVIDKDYLVLKAVALNADGTKVITGMDVKNKPVDSVVTEMLKETRDYGYIKPGEKSVVLISAALNDVVKDNRVVEREDVEKLDRLLEDIKKDIAGYDSNISGKTVRVTSKERNSAKKFNISMGKYFLFLKAREQGINIAEESLESMKVSELIESLNTGIAKVDDPIYTQEPQYTLQPALTPVGTPVPVISIPERTPTAERTLTPVKTPVLTLQPSTSPTPGQDSKTSLSPVPTVSTQPAASPEGEASQTPWPTIALTPSQLSTPTASNTSEIMDKVSLKLQHKGYEKGDITQGIHYDFIIVNTGTESVDLKDVKVRYYLEEEADKPLRCAVYFNSRGEESDINRAFYNITGTDSSNKYLEITFDSGRLPPGETVYVFGEILREDWSEFDQSDDYSYKSSGRSFEDWNRMTVYFSDILVWGIEPD